MRAPALVLTAVLLGAALTGCAVVPLGYGGHGHHPRLRASDGHGHPPYAHGHPRSAGERTPGRSFRHR